MEGGTIASSDYSRGNPDARRFQDVAQERRRSKATVKLPPSSTAGSITESSAVPKAYQKSEAIAGSVAPRCESSMIDKRTVVGFPPVKLPKAAMEREIDQLIDRAKILSIEQTSSDSKDSRAPSTEPLSSSSSCSGPTRSQFGSSSVIIESPSSSVASAVTTPTFSSINALAAPFMPATFDSSTPRFGSNEGGPPEGLPVVSAYLPNYPPNAPFDMMYGMQTPVPPGASYPAMYPQDLYAYYAPYPGYYPIDPTFMYAPYPPQPYMYHPTAQDMYAGGHRGGRGRGGARHPGGSSRPPRATETPSPTQPSTVVEQTAPAFVERRESS